MHASAGLLGMRCTAPATAHQLTDRCLSLCLVLLGSFEAVADQLLARVCRCSMQCGCCPVEAVKSQLHCKGIAVSTQPWPSPCIFSTFASDSPLISPRRCMAAGGATCVTLPVQAGPSSLKLLLQPTLTFLVFISIDSHVWNPAKRTWVRMSSSDRHAGLQRLQRSAGGRTSIPGLLDVSLVHAQRLQLL